MGITTGKVGKPLGCYKNLPDAVHVARDKNEYFKSLRSSFSYKEEVKTNIE